MKHSINWNSDRQIVRAVRLTATPDQSCQNLFSTFWPFCLDLFSPLNPVFLGYGVDLSESKNSRVWQARDGRIPLGWFLQHTAPASFGARLLVHHRLQSEIPARWRSHTGVYAARPKQTKGKARDLLIAGIVNSEVMTLDELEKELDRIMKLYKRKSRGGKVYLMPMVRQTSCDADPLYHAEFLYRLVGAFGSRCEFMRWKDFESRTTLNEFYYAELNGFWLYADSYLEHLALSRGAQLLDPPYLGKGELVVPVSANHEVAVIDSTVRKAVRSSELSPGLIQFWKEMHQSQEQSGGRPWPDWFSKVIRSRQQP